VVARKAAGTLRWREQNSAGRLSARAPSNERAGAVATQLPWPVSFQNASQRPFPWSGRKLPWYA